MRGLLLWATCSLLAAKGWAVGYCNDNEESCSNWARAGECTGANAKVVLQTCPHSCGVCTITCEDTDDNCGSWAKAGQCKENADYMMKRCPTSCGLCAPKCKDVHADCPSWTQAGACSEVRRLCYAFLAAPPLSPRAPGAEPRFHDDALPGILWRLPWRVQGQA